GTLLSDHPDDRATGFRLAPDFLAELRDMLAVLATVEPAALSAQAPTAHRLAGAAATLGALRLAAAARRLQKQAVLLPAEALAELRAEILEFGAEAVAAIEEVVATRGADQAVA
ncbi:MAG TPA: Hpt domain-containing protein, partial [Crenalkalicoccus sp.]|nr:Hpt domain-containing protein [Crenalkalicoccus sp.]